MGDYHMLQKSPPATCLRSTSTTTPIEADREKCKYSQIASIYSVIHGAVVVIIAYKEKRNVCGIDQRHGGTPQGQGRGLEWSPGAADNLAHNPFSSGPQVARLSVSDWMSVSVVVVAAL
jgi:hypothetical protein